MNDLIYCIISAVLFQVSTEPIYIVTEFMRNGSLLDYLRQGTGKHTIFTEHIDIAAQVLYELNLKSSFKHFVKMFIFQT